MVFLIGERDVRLLFLGIEMVMARGMRTKAEWSGLERWDVEEKDDHNRESK